LVVARRTGDRGLVEDLASGSGCAVVVEHDHPGYERGQLLRVPAHLAGDDRPHRRRDPFWNDQLGTSRNRVGGPQEQCDGESAPQHRRRGNDCSRLHVPNMCERRASSNAGRSPGPSRNSCARPSPPRNGCARWVRRPLAARLRDARHFSCISRGLMDPSRRQLLEAGALGALWLGAGCGRRVSATPTATRLPADVEIALKATRGLVALNGSSAEMTEVLRFEGKALAGASTALSQDDAGYLGPTFRV